MIRVSEIFGPTIQGEGAQAGRPTVFVRTGGCDYRCAWCDTPYAVYPEYRHEWTKMSNERVLEAVEALSEGEPIRITLSGGNPATQSLEKLLDMGHERGHTFTMETQGSIPRPWFVKLDHLCLSPKPPSSLMDTDWAQLDACLDVAPADTILKVVVFDEQDMDYAGKVRERYASVPLYLQVGNVDPVTNTNPLRMLEDLERLWGWTLDRRWYDVRVLPQIHALVWGNRRGV